MTAAHLPQADPAERATVVLHREGARVRVEDGRLCVEHQGEPPLLLPPHRVGALLCYGSVGVTGALVAMAMHHHMAITFFSEAGRFLGRLDPVADAETGVEESGGGSLCTEAVAPAPAFAAERGQWAILLHGDSLPWARSFVLAKLQNTRGLLLRARRREALPPAEAAALDDALDAVDLGLRQATLAPDLPALRGHEGAAARAWFAALPLLLQGDVRADFPFHGRSRRPPADPFNALLSFLYALLQHDVLAAVQAAGLDPRVGFLHTPRRGRPALAFDLMEELRPVLADRLALALLNRRQLRFEHFTPHEEGFRLTPGALRILFTERDRRLRAPMPYDAAPGGRAPLGRIPYFMALDLAAALRVQDPTRRHPFLPDL